MSEQPNDEPVEPVEPVEPIDGEALANAARAFLDEHDEIEQTEKVTVIRTPDGTIWVDTDLSPEVAHFLLHIGAHHLMQDEARWSNSEDDDENEEEEDYE